MVELVPEKLKKKINDSFSLNKVEKVFYKLDLQRKIKIFVNEFLQIPTEPFGKELAILQTHELFQYSKADKEAAAYNIEGLDTEKIKTAILKLNFIKVWPYYQRMNILFPYLIKYVGNSEYENINMRVRLFSQIKNEIFIICKNKGLIEFFDEMNSKLIPNNIILNIYLKELLR